MKSIVLNMVILLVALMACDFNLPSFETRASDNHQLSRIPELDIIPLSNLSLREHQKQQNYIADPFIPIVVIAHTLYENRDFSFYLPIHGLHHLRQFFLLI